MYDLRFSNRQTARVTLSLCVRNLDELRLTNTASSGIFSGKQGNFALQFAAKPKHSHQKFPDALTARSRTIHPPKGGCQGNPSEF
jgi:hypothetical protein